MPQRLHAACAGSRGLLSPPFSSRGGEAEAPFFPWIWPLTVWGLHPKVLRTVYCWFASAPKSEELILPTFLFPYGVCRGEV